MDCESALSVVASATHLFEEASALDIHAIGLYYRDFHQLDDAEVVELMAGTTQGAD